MLGGGEVVISALFSGCRRLLPNSSQISMSSSFIGLDCERAWVSGLIASWETFWASSLVWACYSTIVSREFGLVGCARDKDLVGVEIGFAPEGL